MRRREFIAGTVALLVSPRRSWAQGTRHRLGFLAVGDGSGRAPQSSRASLTQWAAKSRLDRRKKPDYRVSIFSTAGSTTNLSRRPDCSQSRCDRCCGTASGRSREIGNCHHTDCIRGCVGPGGVRPRAKHGASRRQHNGSCNLRAGRFHRQAGRNPSRTASQCLENCALGQSA